MSAAALAVLLGAASAAAQEASSDADTDAPTVNVAPVKAEDVTRSIDFVGHVEAIQEVELTARVEGVLERVAFTEGGLVESGQVLFEIEEAPYEAEMASANAAHASGLAARARAQAALTQAERDVERQTVLVEKETVSQAVLDTAIARRDEAKADLEAANAQIAQANAQIQAAKLNLSYTQIVSPIEGRIGRANVTAGNLVNPQTGALATIVQLDPIRVSFAISERNYLTIAKQHIDEADDETRKAFVPTLHLADGSDYAHAGEITFIDNRVDPRTGTIAVRAEFPNPDALLVPGQFVRVTVAASDPQHLPMVPAAAVLQDRDGPHVLVLDDDNRAQIRRIETGERTADSVAVTDGLAEGEVVIVGGIQRVHPGQVVAPQPAGSGS